MMFSEIPLRVSSSENAAASTKISTDSSKEQRIKAPVSYRLSILEHFLEDTVFSSFRFGWDLSVDTVAGDRHQVTTERHHIRKHRQVAIIHIRAVEFNDVAHLF